MNSGGYWKFREVLIGVAVWIGSIVGNGNYVYS